MDSLLKVEVLPVPASMSLDSLADALSVISRYLFIASVASLVCEGLLNAML